ncbi:MAG: hypothetical protein L6R35_005171 [Caloplaca aegaea]|nr:MAG: hypothetical protein L6R35_005171 [Caloplaca aegaea]
MAKTTLSTVPGRLSTGLDSPSAQAARRHRSALRSSPKPSVKAKAAANAPVRAVAANAPKKRGRRPAPVDAPAEEDEQLEAIQTPRGRKARHAANNPATKTWKIAEKASHPTSQDLYHWENQPIAIYPSAQGQGIFSGSCVVDVNNTSGFFPNQTNGVVAIYTLHTSAEETQEIAYSFDDGYTFTNYSANPVISINSTQIRDPKVIWHAPTERWVMVIAYSQEFVIGIYTSPNLKNWTHASNFPRHGLLGLQYECPNLIEVPMLTNSSLADPLDPSNYASENMYLLAISINPGAPLGGSITEYFPGSFNGTHFVPADAAARIADFGKDNYAGQWFYGIPPSEPQIGIAWASNWQYSQQVPTGQLEGFRSAILANTTTANSSLLYDYSTTVPSGALTLSMNLTNIPLVNGTGTANFTFLSSVTGESIRGGFFLGGDTPFWLDRGETRGFDNPFFTDKFSVMNLIDRDTRTTRVMVVIDRSILEVFLDNGLRSATANFFPRGSLDTCD